MNRGRALYGLVFTAIIGFFAALVFMALDARSANAGGGKGKGQPDSPDVVCSEKVIAGKAHTLCSYFVDHKGYQRQEMLYVVPSGKNKGPNHIPIGKPF